MKQERYLLIEPHGKLRWISVDPLHSYDRFLAELGCSTLENVVTVLPGIWMLVDGEYLLKDPLPPINRCGCRLYRGFMEGGHPILGNILIGAEGIRSGEPDFVPMNAVQRDLLSRYLGLCVEDPRDRGDCR